MKWLLLTAGALVLGRIARELWWHLVAQNDNSSAIVAIGVAVLFLAVLAAKYPQDWHDE